MLKYSKLVENVLSTPNGSKRDEVMAFITHYLQIPNNKCPDYIKLNAVEIIRSFYGALADSLIKNKNEIVWDVPFPKPHFSSFSFIELFAGIGGFRLGLESIGGRCIFASEVDWMAKNTYHFNFGMVPFGDISKYTNSSQIVEKHIAEHDILTAGFPCQPFSNAGKRMGFADTRGTLFYHIQKILKKKRPRAFILENVQGLKTHNEGETLGKIIEILKEKLNYYVIKPFILNAVDFGLPQNRKRLFIVGFKYKSAFKNFNIPIGKPTTKKFKNISHHGEVPIKYYLSQGYLDTLKTHKTRESSKGNNFGYKIIGNNDYANVLLTGGAGREMNLVYDEINGSILSPRNRKTTINNEHLRIMTPREWARLMGFPHKFKFKKAGTSNTQAYKQLGNAVCVPVVEALGREVINALKKQKK
jgi:DNA (cytosine-5)-methyltransferase 1|tara:strand:+ start:263 stop:1510 length:1248 start_codon:yes stop_codon:yes gene_type:complete